jgi:hypothetical protein
MPFWRISNPTSAARMAVRNDPQRCGGGPKLLKADHVLGLRMHAGHPCSHKRFRVAVVPMRVVGSPWLDFFADL